MIFLYSQEMKPQTPPELKFYQLPRPFQVHRSTQVRILKYLPMAFSYLSWRKLYQSSPLLVRSSNRAACNIGNV
ncbi:Uncharacterized protein APZ42_024231 [Daphnia magna]|uniref:Uncharacterized protein n=1 Tax=Daphnia magna TaxID=35525 RepID=A0A164UKH7_9CRUS|nr:Uncharacterized protein APZ42_024231 [Daphnia magna]